MPKHQFSNTFIGRESRKSKYTKWSERAVVVGYNSENQSYDIVITTERLVGANKRTLNKTIRRVKSIFPSDVDTFLPGTAVLVGYISDKREHPVILGQGDNVIQTPSKVTLGPTLNVESPPENPSPLEPVELTPTPCTGFLFDSVTGSTTTLTLDCTTLDIGGCFTTNAIAPSNCGCGAYEYSLSGGLVGSTNCDIGQAPIAVVSTTLLCPDGPGDSVLTICPPKNIPSVPGIAYVKGGVNKGCASAGCGTCIGPPSGAATQNCNTTFRCERFGCDDVFQSTTSILDCCTPTSPSLGLCPSAVLCSGGCGTVLGTCCFEMNNCQGQTFTLDPCTGTGPGLFVPILDKRTPTMITNGCTPCRFSMDDTVLTATDACGRMFSLEIEILPAF